jgi:hypothetical protein
LNSNFKLNQVHMPQITIDTWRWYCRFTIATTVTLGMSQSSPLKRNLDLRYEKEKGSNIDNEESHVPSLW